MIRDNRPIEMKICHNSVSSSSLTHSPCPEMEALFIVIIITVSMPKESFEFVLSRYMFTRFKYVYVFTRYKYKTVQGTIGSL